MKRGTPYHRKINRLIRSLHLARWQAVGLAEMLWHLTARDTPHGDVGKLSDEDIAAGIEWAGDSQELVRALEEAELIDPHPVFRYIIHDWPEHCDDWVHATVARSRRPFADGTIPSLRLVNSKEREKLAAFFAQLSPAPDPLPEAEVVEAPQAGHGKAGGPPVESHGKARGAFPSLSFPSLSEPAAAQAETSPGELRTARAPAQTPPRKLLLQDETHRPTNTPPRHGFEPAGSVLGRSAPGLLGQWPQSARTWPAAGPGDRMPPRSAPAPAIATGQIDKTRLCLADYPQVARVHWGPPPRGVCERILSAFDGDLCTMADWLRQMRDRRKQGDDWGWLIAIAERERDERMAVTA
jgi:hypothetical protein